LKTKKKTGGARMHERGRRPSQLWYTPEDYDQVQRAARLVRRPMTQFAIMAALAEAKKVLDETGVTK
jgi:uncharacterized protein (DUF1778 family)